MLYQIQNELKAPKNQTNTFGKYKYRSCEDIEEALKPILFKHEASMFISDEIVLIGERYYIKAIVNLTLKDGAKYVATSYAREEDSKKGMDASQLTGATSSYARKYALNAMFLIDDTKDSDATNTHGKDEPKITKEELQNRVLEIKALIIKSGANKAELLKYFKVDSVENLPYENTVNALKSKIEKAKNGTN